MDKKRPDEYVRQVYFPDRKAWRDWLTKNYDKEKSIWLVHDKQSQGGRLLYDDIVEEALCFGWIDSTVRKLDGKRSMIYLSVRRPKSIWARSNKDRVEQLVKMGIMTEAGMKLVEKAKADGSWSQLDVVENLVVPDELKRGFAQNKKAEPNFDRFSTSLKKQILYFIYSAKLPETREKRVKKILPSIESGRNPFA
jgi:uncharacterized protein YdeI (YjbR/CyaY-like superfamily)